MTVEFLLLLLLIIIANGAPILIRRLLNGGFNLAVDFGQKLPDKNRLFGSSKTWRGIAAALFATATAAWLLGYSPETGMLVAVYAILGDLGSSFMKRRLSMASSSMAPLLDQVPESLFPALMMRHTFNLDILSVILLVLIFIIIELALSHILYKYGIRKKPY
ncbi:MAG: CDP-archaeol synthase [Gammaproteobacteria bacterium]|nr:CDP-archaeol synthase [Gammaproteobacteria bacterium]